MANGYRDQAGLGRVSFHSVIDTIAVERIGQVVAEGQLIHDFDYIRERLDDEGICWRGFGEILAWNGSGSFSAFGTQWYNSTTHRNIMLGDYTHAGGARRESNDRFWGVMIFVKLCNATTTPALGPGGFTDTATSSFGADIAWLVDQGITSGCSDTRFCPTSPVRRGQMASFMARALDLPWTNHDYFVDDETSTHEVAINSTREARIASGCTKWSYCPASGMTRAQMASFLVRALDLPPASADHFVDDNGTTHEDAINALAEAGIASGCSGSRFCPTSTVSREQMAAFLHRALD
jgi:hypothetical protein